VERLLNRISLEYKEYYYKLHKKMCEGIAYRKYEFRKNTYEMVKQFHLEQINDTLDFIQPHPAPHRIKENEVVRLITQRDKARKQGDFKQADQIRERLSREGVLLLDQKHANGKSCKTTWKYIDE
jgi:cysteinyl-tRNA synthetase